MEELDVFELEDDGGGSGFLFEVERSPDEGKLLKVIFNTHY